MFDEIYCGKRVLITGHTGFKGSWLMLWLLELGANVAGFASDVPTTPANFDVLNLAARVRHFEGDVRDRAALGAAIDAFRPQIVFHLAAQSLVRRSYDDPAATFEVNTMGTVNLLECVRARPWIEVVVLITSDKAYRNVEWCWGYREDDQLGGKDPYSASKGAAELVAYSYLHSYFMDSQTRIATTRAGNVIGGGDWALDRIVPDCMRAWSVGDAVSVRHPGATRPWQHVLEPLSGYLLLGQHLWQRREDSAGQSFNFGPDASVNQSVAALLNAMAVRWPGAGWDAQAEPQAGHEAMLLKLSCDKALHMLNWRAVLLFDETVSLTVDWYRHYYAGGDDMFSFTVAQIEQYCRLAQQRELAWTR